VRIALNLLTLSLAMSCADTAAREVQRIANDTVALPPPEVQGTMSVEEALQRRRSVREFDDGPLSQRLLGQILWAAQGITSREGLRTAPSAGALYPLELYVATVDGVFHYEPRFHRLRRRTTSDRRPAMAAAAGAQDAVRRAPAVVVITAVAARTASRYGDRTARYVYLEAGHVAQNVLLQATARALVGVPVGAFDDETLARALALPNEERPVYLIPLGRPRR
jgi:SagB-type dehydrogenase family enzyme